MMRIKLFIIFLSTPLYTPYMVSSDVTSVEFSEIIQHYAISYTNTVLLSKNSVDIDFNIPHKKEKYLALLENLKGIPVPYTIHISLLKEPILGSKAIWQSLVNIGPHIADLGMENFAYAHLDARALQQLDTFTTLTSFRISGVSEKYDLLDTLRPDHPTLPIIIASLTQLSKLSLGTITPSYRVFNINDAQIIQIIRNLSQLYSLSLCSLELMNINNAVGDCVELSTSLKKLNLCGCANIQPPNMSSFLSSLQRTSSLKMVGLYNNQRTSCFINQYVETNSSLKKLSLQYDLRDTDNSIYSSLLRNSTLCALALYHTGALLNMDPLSALLKKDQLHKATIFYNPYGPENCDEEYEFTVWRNIQESLEKNTLLQKLELNPDVVIEDDKAKLLVQDVTYKINQNNIRHTSLLKLLYQ